MQKRVGELKQIINGRVGANHRQFEVKSRTVHHIRTYDAKKIQRT